MSKEMYANGKGAFGFDVDSSVREIKKLTIAIGVIVGCSNFALRFRRDFDEFVGL